MRSPQSLTQRLVPALAVTAVATLLFGAVVVTADVATAEGQALPATFGIAEPRVGDAWRYNLTLDGDWTFGTEDLLPLNETVPFGTFQWAASAPVRGPDGRLHDANYYHAEHLGYWPGYLQARVESETTAEVGTEEPETQLSSGEGAYWSNTTSSAWILAGTPTILSRGWFETGNDTNTNYGIGFPGGPSVMPSFEKFMWESGRLEFPEDQQPCLAFNPLQGGNVSLTEALPLLAPCTLGGQLVTFPEGLLLRATAIENRSGVQTIRFDGQLNGTYQAWFTPSVPYPIRLEVALPNERPTALEEGDLDLPGPRRLVLEMTGFAPGDVPLDGVDDPADTQALPELVLGEPLYVGATRVGPDESGLDHPFSLGAAFQAALDATTFNDLDTYLAAHPLAYVAAAQYQEGPYAASNPFTAFGGYDRVWRIGMTDGQEIFSFQAAQQSFDNFAPVAARNETQPVYSFQRDYAPDGPWSTAPYPNRLPATMPTLRSLADRWAGFDGSGLEANAWGFLIQCLPDETDEEAPCRMQTAYNVGHERYVQGGTSPGGVFAFGGVVALPGNPYGTEENIQIRRFVTFDAVGDAGLVFIEDYRHYRAASDGPLPGSSIVPPFLTSRDAGYKVQSVAVSGIPPAYANWLPEPKQAAQITFLGVVVGFLYWIWPKLGVVGLFSRLHKSELLDHPARAKLVQIVEAQPGIHFHDLAQKAELANGTAVHHLRKLADSGHINVRRSGRYTCYFPTGRVDPTQAAAAPLLKSDGARQVLDAVRSKPGMSNLELAQAIGLQPSTVNYHVQRLANAGLLATLRDGRNVRLHPGARVGALDAADAAGAAA